MLLQQSLVLSCLTLFAITDGRVAPLGKYAHHVSIRLKGVHICSGSIINERHILTSYSCIISTAARDLTVVAGTNSLETDGYLYGIQEIITPDSSYDDIAILRTHFNIGYRRGVQKIDIDNHNEYVINSPLTVVGWERPLSGGNYHNAMMQEFSYRLFNRDICKMQNNLFDRKFICIIDPTGQVPCNMDHGGGIIADGYLIGIYLNRQSCDDRREPSAHTPIHEYMNWIKSNSNVPKITKPAVSGVIVDSCSSKNGATNSIYKYHVSVRRYNQHICSGSIINKRFILTSQLCVRDSPEDLYVIVGTNSLTYPGVAYKVEKIISHPGDDDFISLLQTDRDIQFNALIQPIAMARYNYGTVGDRVIFTAFELPVNGKFINDKLQAFSWKIFDLKECGKEYDDHFYQSFICTMDPCHESISKMDYGGAVVMGDVQIGMKFHPDARTPHAPIVHHRIHHYSKWIEQNSALNRLTPPAGLYIPTRYNEFDHNAPIGAYPYHVSIRHQNQHICSGSIINERHVLTSNDCILSHEAEDLYVVAGTNSLRRGGVRYHVQKIIPTYDHKYDLAILRTTTDISFGSYIQPIDISTHNDDTNTPRKLELTGWEREIIGQFKNDFLQQIFYETYDRNLCMRKIPFLSEAHMCSTTSSYAKICYMDYGGPIVANQVQVGLNPFGVRCEVSEGNNGPFLYLPLAKHAVWIQRNSRI